MRKKVNSRHIMSMILPQRRVALRAIGHGPSVHRWAGGLAVATRISQVEPADHGLISRPCNLGLNRNADRVDGDAPIFLVQVLQTRRPSNCRTMGNGSSEERKHIMADGGVLAWR